jgi:hypothetical protein
MARLEIKKLPKDFRYLLTTREIKEIELEGGFKFIRISTGNIGSADHFQKESYIQSSFRLFSLQCIRGDESWEAGIFQSGFRRELLPTDLEHEVKSKIKEEILEYLNKLNNSLETDNLRRPQLWCILMVINDRPKFTWTEHK